MRPVLPTLALMLAALSPAAAQIVAPTSVNATVGRLGTVVAKVDAEAVKYLVIGAAGPGVEGVSDDAVFDAFREFDPNPVSAKTTLRIRILGVKPGLGYVAIVAVKAGEPLIHLVTVHVKAAPGPVPPPPVPPGPGPSPDPGPGPQPPPVPPDPPVPTGTVKYLVLIEETADAAATRGAFFADPTLQGRLKAKGITWRAVDKDAKDASGQPPADVARFIAEAKGHPLSRVYLVDDKGRTLYAGNLPDDPARLLILLEKYGG